MKRFLSIAVILLFQLPTLAQQYYMRGEVRDETGTPLQNVSILLHSTGYVYHSGATGSFGIVTAKQFDTLTFYLDGYQRQVGYANATGYINITLKKAANAKNTRSYKLASITQNLKREAIQHWFTGEETYASLVENGFIAAEKYPTTGITLNIDRASYSNIRRFITTGSPVPPDAVRIEEMLNYFNMGYTAPADNKIFDVQTALTNCPWNSTNQLLFASIRSKKVALDSLPPSHLVFLIDVSGSMDMPNRLPMLKAGFRGLVNNLRPIDSVSVVVYGGITGVLLNATSGGDKEKIYKVIDSLTAGGATPGESGIKLAYSVARNHFIKGGNNRVILATDGDFNVGLRSEAELEELITAQCKSGIYLTCLGVGMGNYKDSKIQTLAQKGNGNFAYIDSYAEADKVLLQEFLQTLYAVADDVYLQASFDPRYVKEYKLIGFDNKAGAIKDTAAVVEGGEIGSGYSMQVVFEITPTEYGVLTRVPAAFKLQYKLPDSAQVLGLVETPEVQFRPLTELDKSYGFACAVIRFGQLLRQAGQGKATEAGWNELIALAANYVEKENLLQQEFLSLVQQAKIVYTKKKKKTPF